MNVEYSVARIVKRIFFIFYSTTYLISFPTYYRYFKIGSNRVVDNILPEKVSHDL